VARLVAFATFLDLSEAELTEGFALLFTVFRLTAEEGLAVKKSMALPIDACAERSTSRTFFSTLFSISTHSWITSESKFSIFVRSLTALADFFFDFMGFSLLTIS
jgi:hypothetical protein